MLDNVFILGMQVTNLVITSLIYMIFYFIYYIAFLEKNQYKSIAILGVLSAFALIVARYVFEYSVSGQRIAIVAYVVGTIAYLIFLKVNK